MEEEILVVATGISEEEVVELKRQLASEREVVRKLLQAEEWLRSHQKELESRYAGKFVAVIAPGEVEASENLETLFKKLEEKGVEPGRVIITAFSPEGEASIL